MSCWKQTKLETLSNIETEFFLSALDKIGYKADLSKKKISKITNNYSEIYDTMK